jgi:Fe-S-cluster containining protein
MDRFMATSDPDLDNPLRDAVLAAAGRADVLARIEQIYSDLAAEVEKRRPICIVSGRCCRFEEFGHHLFVTTAELAAFVHGLETTPKSAQLLESIKKWDGIGCPFQVARMCGVHAIRPFGCRVFFCDETSTQWQNQAYEAFHARLKQLHEDLAIPYFYLEWRQALQKLSLTQISSPDSRFLLSMIARPFDKKTQ